MTTMHLLRQLVLALGLALSLPAAEDAAAPGANNRPSPEAAFNTFKEAMLAKNKDLLKTLVVTDEEDMKRNLDKLDKMPEEERTKIREASIADSKTDGEFALGIVKFLRDGKPGYDDIYFVRREGQWHLCMNYRQTIPQETVTKLRDWYIARKRELSAPEKTTPEK
jgi:hypothetical protein